MLNKATVLIAMLVLSLSVHADIYHFNGVITDVHGPDVTHNVGDQFNFTIEIDFQSPGYRTIGGNIELLNSTDDYTYYAAEYISGDAVENVAWDSWTNHYYDEHEPTSGGSATINVLNNLALVASGVLSIDSWDTAPNLLFYQDWRNDSFVGNHIQGQITSFTVDDDSDSDGVSDAVDNCTLKFNPSQLDTDADGYGNLCDADFNNDCVVNFIDFSAFGSEFLGSNPLFDIDSSGSVNFIDYAIVTSYFLAPPGPSGASSTCE